MYCSKKMRKLRNSRSVFLIVALAASKVYDGSLFYIVIVLNYNSLCFLHIRHIIPTVIV